MKPCATVLLLLAAGSALADQPEWLAEHRHSGEGVMQRLEQTRQQIDKKITSMGADYDKPIPESADDSLPEAQEGYAVAVADLGLFFDRNNAQAAYIGNVRVNEARLQFRCRNRLYIKMSNEDRKAGEKQAKHASAPVPPPAQPTPEEAPVATPESEQEGDAQASAPKKAEPVIATAYNAIVDNEGNNILLLSNGDKGVPQVKRGTSELVLEPRADGQNSYLLADCNGGTHVQAGTATMHWVDSQGRPGTLVAKNGRIDFNRGSNTIFVDGPSHISMPDGATLDSQESLCVTLHPSPDAPQPKDGEFMAQFTSMRFDGVEKAVARGDVHAKRPAVGKDTPEATAAGEICTYNAATGDCALEGDHCTLAYGPQTVQTKGDITLAANGDITIHGSEVTGTYVLPDNDKEKTAAPGDKATSAPAQPVCGNYRTSGEVRFRAEDGTVTFPAGLEAKDPYNHFSCTGNLVATLKKTKGKSSKPGRTGMLNLAVASYGDISTLDATGNVEIHYLNAAQKQVLDVRGEHAVFDVEHGTAHVAAAPGQTALLSYGKNRITARAEGEATMHVDEAGDIDVQGDAIHAELPFQQNHAVVDCSSYMKLKRATGEMELGGKSKINYPGGIMTANGPIFAELAPGPESAKPSMARYPHLFYNFSGLKSATTQRGGTLRTEKASMECTGPIRVTIAPAPPTPKGKKPKNADDKGDLMPRMRAQANGNVAILTRDASGKLLRATGDTMTINGATGVKTLTGQKVTLSDKNNTHIASGKGACVTVDRNNNARITGEKQVTTATRIHEQMEQNKKKP